MATATIVNGHRYSAEVDLSWIEGFASDDMLVAKLAAYGFADVTVTGSGETRQAQGTWTGETMTGEVDSHLSRIVDLGPA
jgi:hypothetical protein